MDREDVNLKTWILGTASALAVALILAIPAFISADATGTTLVEGSITPSISSISPDSGIQGNTYPNITVSGDNFTGAAAAGVSFGDGITVNSITVDSDEQITASITIASGAGGGSRDVSVTVSGATGTQASAFSVEELYISIVPPGDISLGDFTKVSTKTGYSATPGSVFTNASHWQVTARDANTGATSGRMLRQDGRSLGSPLQIGKVSGSYINAGDPVGVIYNQSDGTSLPIYVSQDISSEDLPGNYSMTIIFTGTIP
jgi:hypothetical protein